MAGEVVAKIDELTPEKSGWSHHATCQKQCAYSHLATFGLELTWHPELAPLQKTF